MNKIYDSDWLEQMCRVFEFEVSTDSIMVDTVLEGLNETKGNCPCVPRAYHSEDTICPCKAMRTKGKCHCGLFKSKEAAV